MNTPKLPPLPKTEHAIKVKSAAVQEWQYPAYSESDMQAYYLKGYNDARAAIEAQGVPDHCDPSSATYDLAAMVMSDCGHSTDNQRLLDRIAARIDKHVESVLASAPPVPQAEKPENFWDDAYDDAKAAVVQQDPVAWKHDCAVLLTNDVELWIDACPNCGKPRTNQAQQAKPQPLSDEQDRALCEAYCNTASDEYFNARPHLDSAENRRIFYAGHRKAWIEWQAAHGIKE